jgi:hypothetical protein
MQDEILRKRSKVEKHQGEYAVFIFKIGAKSL